MIMAMNMSQPNAFDINSNEKDHVRNSKRIRTRFSANQLEKLEG